MEHKQHDVKSLVAFAFATPGSASEILNSWQQKHGCVPSTETYRYYMGLVKNVCAIKR